MDDEAKSGSRNKSRSFRLQNISFPCVNQQILIPHANQNEPKNMRL